MHKICVSRYANGDNIEYVTSMKSNPLSPCQRIYGSKLITILDILWE